MSGAMVQVRQQFTEVSNMLTREHERLALVAPSGFSPTRLTRIALNALARNPRLLECKPQSIVHAVTLSAELGLELGGALGEAYLVPFKEKGVTKAQMIPGYRGLIKLAVQHPDVASMRADLVRAGDVFAYQLGTDPRIDHTPGQGTIEARGEVTHAYAVAFMKHGPPQFSVMDRSELDPLYAEAKKKSGAMWWAAPWNKHTDEMRRKSPIRRLCKTMDLSTLLRRALEHEDSLHATTAPIEASRGDALKDKLRGEAAAPPEAVEAEFESLEDLIQEPEGGQ
jgi:recombination protein RecT